MARHQEPLNGGLWTAEDPGLLEAGQLPVILNGIYRPGSQALQRTPGRDVFGVVSATAVNVVGLRDLKFDNGNHYLVAHASSSYLTATVGETGTFGVLSADVGIGSQLEVVQYRNRFFLFNGPSQNATATAVNRNQVVYLTATGAASLSTRQHGMAPVETTPNVTTAGGGLFSQSITGYYEYWTTEAAQYVQDGVTATVEGTFIGQPATVLISATAVQPTIQQPGIANPLVTTHWRVYRSPKKDVASDKKFPTGFLVSEVPTAATSVVDTSTTASASSMPANANGVGDGATVWADFTNPSAMFVDDTNNSTAPLATLLGLKQQGVYGFNLGGFTGTVKGITVEIGASVSTGTVPVSVRLCRGRQTDGSNTPPGEGWLQTRFLSRYRTSGTKSFTVTTSSIVAYTLGGATDRWLDSEHPRPFNPSDFTSAGFMVVLSSSSASAKTLSVDYVKVTVHYGATFDSVVVFPTVAYTFGDVVAQVGKNGPPPTSNTADLFEDTLVVNDIENPALVRYSFPGEPEAFPATYYLDFETRDNDRVRCIKVVNNRCMVWLDNAVYRLNYLPSERDASFDRGKATEMISGQYGAVNPMCVAVYSPEGSIQKAAFVSHKGIFATDGYNLEELTGGLDWRGVISTTATSTPICLINNAEDQELVFYYRNDGLASQETYVALHLCYSEDHLVNGRPKVSGPVVMRNFATPNYASLESAWAVQRSAGHTSIYLGYGGSETGPGAGKVYIVSGENLPTNYPHMRYQTREMYLSNYGGEWRSNDLVFYLSGGPATAHVRASARKTNDDSGYQVGGLLSKSFDGRRLMTMSYRIAGDAITYAVTSSGQVANEHRFLLIDGTDFGVSDQSR